MHADFRFCPVCATELVMRADSAAGADGDVIAVLLSTPALKGPANS